MHAFPRDCFLTLVIDLSISCRSDMILPLLKNDCAVLHLFLLILFIFLIWSGFSRVCSARVICSGSTILHALRAACALAYRRCYLTTGLLSVKFLLFISPIPRGELAVEKCRTFGRKRLPQHDLKGLFTDDLSNDEDNIPLGEAAKTCQH